MNNTTNLVKQLIDLYLDTYQRSLYKMIHIYLKYFDSNAHIVYSDKMQLKFFINFTAGVIIKRMPYFSTDEPTEASESQINQGNRTYTRL